MRARLLSLCAAVLGLLLGYLMFHLVSAPQPPHAPDIRTIDRMLLAAVRRGDANAVEQLLFMHADPNARDSEGEYAISLAAEPPKRGETLSGDRRRDYEQIVRALIHYGGHTNVRNREGQTPLDQAKRMGSAGLVALLRDRPAASN